MVNWSQEQVSPKITQNVSNTLKSILQDYLDKCRNVAIELFLMSFCRFLATSEMLWIKMFGYFSNLGYFPSILFSLIFNEDIV
jgi:hypothetical protein